MILINDITIPSTLIASNQWSIYHFVMIILAINHKNQAEHDTNQRYHNTKYFNRIESMVNLPLCYDHSNNQSQKSDQT